MTELRVESVEALQLSLHGTPIGTLVHYSGGKNKLTFDPGYIATDPIQRPMLTLTQRQSPAYLEKPHIHNQRVSPILSNLLPEGSLREWMAAGMKIHPDNEFPMLAWSGLNLPGALEARPVPMGELPGWALESREQVEAVQINIQSRAQKFSLAGVQMKFSAIREDGRLNVSVDLGDDNWIVKTPSNVHGHVPENEYSSMRLAEAIGVDIPNIELIDLAVIENLPDIQLPAERLAYVIKRFDRDQDNKIHTEDFA